jgi:hypothetical protein
MPPPAEEPEDPVNDLFSVSLAILLLACLTAGIVMMADLSEEPAEPETTLYEGRPVPEWLDDLREQSPYTRQEADDALKRIGPENRATAPEFTEALADDNSNVRRVAARSLGQIGPDAKDAIPALDRAMVGSRNGSELKEIITAEQRIRNPSP